MEKNNSSLSYIAAGAFWLLAFVIALKVGSVPNASFDVISELRLPRAVMASAVGMGLAVAGAALQALFANPLCEPYTLGISSGAALGAILGSILGVPALFSGIAGSAFLGALSVAFVLYLISKRKEGSGLTLLLSGVMIGLVGSSLVALCMAISDTNGVQGAILWFLGDLSRARLRGSLLSFLGIVILVFQIWSRSQELDALLMGEEGAQSLGIEVARVRKRIILLSSLLVGVCVSASGMIGFVGLVIPHFSRRLVGSLHHRLIPLCAIWGAASLTAADAVARKVVSPYEVPVGVVTALVGAPLFIWMMLKGRAKNE